MKKTAIFLLSILTASLFLTSCQDHQDQAQLYNVLVNEETRSINNVDASKYGKFSMNGEQYNNADIAETKAENILNNNYTLNYTHSIASGMYCDNMDYYYDDALDCEVAYSTNTGNLTRIRSKESTGQIISYGKSMSNTDDYLLWLNNVVESTFAVSVDTYRLTCRTYYKNNGLTYNFFVDPKTDIDDQVSFYVFVFVKHIGQYASSEKFKIIANPDGSINSIAHFELPCDIFTEISVDEAKLDKTIEKTVYGMSSSKYKIKNYTVKNMTWDYYEGKPYLMCGVSIRSIDSDGDDFGQLIMLAIDLES